MKASLFILLISFIAICFFNSANGDDIIQPSWRGNPRTTFQEWTFDFDDSNPAFPEYINNPYGDAVAHIFVIYPAGAGWVDYLLRRTGVWADLEAIDISIDNINDPLGRKEVWIQVTYYLAISAPPVINIPGGVFISGDDIEIEFDGLGAWMLRQEVWEISPNPASEEINITTNPAWGMVIDQIVVDTACFLPETEKPVITDVARNSTGSLEVTWTSHANWTYAIEASTSPYDYDENNMTWEWIATGVPGADFSTTWEDTNTLPLTGEKYYRVYAEGPIPLKADDTVGFMLIRANIGRNMISSPFEPYPVGGGTPGLSTLDKIVGNQLTGHNLNKTLSDNIEIWDNMLASYKRAWYKTGTTNAWQDWDVAGSPSFGMDSDKGYWFNIISGHPAKDIMFCGRVSKTSRSIPISIGRNLVGSCFPVNCTLEKSGLVASGFTGHYLNKAFSDNVEFWNNTLETYERFWYKTGTTNAWQPWNNGGPIRDIIPGDSIWVNVISGHNPFTWTYPVPPRP